MNPASDPPRQMGSAYRYQQLPMFAPRGQLKG
jgi:hypothetical protein